MRVQRCALHYLLLGALLAGQWFYTAHSHQDDAPDSDHHCQVCIHGVQLDASLPAAAPRPPVLTPQNSFITPALTNRSTFHERFHDSRAPPSS